MSLIRRRPETATIYGRLDRPSLAVELQSLDSDNQRLKLIALVSGDRRVFIPREVAINQSGLLKDLIGDLSSEFNYDSNNEIELPINPKYARVLSWYAIYLGNLKSNVPEYRVTESSLDFLVKQKRIVENYTLLSDFIPSSDLPDQLYLQFDLASYLEDFGYFQAAMNELYKFWTQAWLRLVLTGPIKEVNFDIYTFTPWSYLPDDLITSPSFLELWWQRNTSLTADNKRASKLVTLSNQLSYKTSERIHVTVEVDAIVADSSNLDIADYRVVQDVNVSFYSGSWRINCESVFFPYLASGPSESLPEADQKEQKLLSSQDRILKLVQHDLDQQSFDRLIQMKSYWDESSNLDRREYVTLTYWSKFNDTPASNRRKLLLTPKLIKVITVKA